MIVIDNSVLVAAFLETGRRAAAAQRVMMSADLIAPELIDVEAVHSARGLLLAGKTSLASAEAFLHELPTLAIERVPHRVLLDRMWELRDNATACDAAYIALAENLGATLSTGDAAMARVPHIRCAVELLS